MTAKSLGPVVGLARWSKAKPNALSGHPHLSVLFDKEDLTVLFGVLDNNDHPFVVQWTSSILLSLKVLHPNYGLSQSCHWTQGVPILHAGNNNFLLGMSRIFGLSLSRA
jgi:hypothetical protein